MSFFYGFVLLYTINPHSISSAQNFGQYSRLLYKIIQNFNTA